MNVKHIMEGLKNSVFVKEEVEKIAAERHKICLACNKLSSNSDKPDFDPGPYYSKLRPDVHCTECACNEYAKTRSLHTNCPLHKWEAVATLEESVKIATIAEEEYKLAS